MRTTPESLTLAVPAQTPEARDSLRDIRPGSAIVCSDLLTPGADGATPVRIDFEGGLYQRDPAAFEDWLQHAASRHAMAYPTIARRHVPRSALVPVGTVQRDPVLRAWVITDLTDPDALSGWTGAKPPAIGGSHAQRQRAAGLAWSDLDPSDQTEIMQSAQQGYELSQAILDAARRRARR